MKINFLSNFQLASEDSKSEVPKKKDGTHIYENLIERDICVMGILEKSAKSNNLNGIWLQYKPQLLERIENMKNCLKLRLEFR